MTDDQIKAPNAEVDKEKPPWHKKHAKTYVFALIGLLVVALVFDTFRRDDKKDKKTADPVSQAPIHDSGADFQTRFKQEIERRKTVAGQPREPETREQTMQRLTQQQRAIYESPGQTIQKVDVEQEFKEAERKRALTARRSRFRLKVAQASPGGRRTAQTDETLSSEKAKIAGERARVLKHLKGLRDGSGPAMPAHTGQDFEGPARQPDMGPAEPERESAPKAGQKLIPAATIINGVLDQKIMSDYIGSYRGLITHDVYDVSGRSIVIPKGSRFTGKCLRISNVNEPIQARMGLTVNRVILPNGKSISFEKADVLDQSGIHAVKDKVNYHFVAQFIGVSAYALLSSGTGRQGSGLANDQTFEGELGRALREQFAPMAEKYLRLVPTITLNSGQPIKIFLEDDIYADEWEPVRNRLIRANRATY